MLMVSVTTVLRRWIILRQLLRKPLRSPYGIGLALESQEPAELFKAHHLLLRSTPKIWNSRHNDGIPGAGFVSHVIGISSIAAIENMRTRVARHKDIVVCCMALRFSSEASLNEGLCNAMDAYRRVVVARRSF